MAPAGNVDWLFAAIGWAGGGLGVLVVLWGLFKDRSRGRRRCPRCWYEMSGVPGLRCPECGTEQKHERRLLRTRRRWRRVAAGAALILGGSIVHDVPGIRARGAWAAVPRPVLAFMTPFVTGDYPPPGAAQPPGHSALAREITFRFLSEPHALRPLWPGEAWLVRAGSGLALRRRGSEMRADLAAGLLVLTDARAIENAPEHARGRVILAASGLMYSRARSYRDVGMVKGTIGRRDEQPFITVFERGERFRFEFRSGHPHQSRLSHRYVVWGRPMEYSSWWTIRPAVERFTDLQNALAGPTGVSGGAAYTIPSMLLGRSGPLVRRPVLQPVEAFDGHDCYVIRGEDALGLTRDLWIDRRTLALRKLKNHWKSPSVTVYRPEIDAPIDDRDFEFDPASPDATPLGSGEEVCRELRTLAGDPTEDVVPVPENWASPGLPPAGAARR